MKRTRKYNVYQVPKFGSPLKIVGNVGLRQAKNMVRNARTGNNFFVGFQEVGKKVSNSGWFRTTK